jgi:hypothetical protein
MLTTMVVVALFSILLERLEQLNEFRCSGFTGLVCHRCLYVLRQCRPGPRVTTVNGRRGPDAGYRHVTTI